MCLTFSDEYEACGHTIELVKWQCISPQSDQHQLKRRYTITRGKEINGDRYPILCQKCFLPPDPRKSEYFKARGQHWYIKPHRDFFESEHEIAQGILERAKKLEIHEFSDPFQLVKASLTEDEFGVLGFRDGYIPKVPYLSDDIISKLQAAHSTLSASFWFSLLSRSREVETAPLEHRTLLVQLQNYLNYSRFAFLARRRYALHTTLNDRMLQLHRVAYTTLPKYLEKEDRVCNICMVPFDGKEKGVPKKERKKD